MGRRGARPPPGSTSGRAASVMPAGVSEDVEPDRAGSGGSCASVRCGGVAGAVQRGCPTQRGALGGLLVVVGGSAGAEATSGVAWGTGSTGRGSYTGEV